MERLGNFVANLLKGDNPVLPKGSGSSKKEEDIIGNEIVVQCKFTGNSNFSILKADLDRLLESSSILDKFPMFVNSNDKNLIVSIPLNEKSLCMLQLIKYLILFHNKAKKFNDAHSNISNNGLRYKRMNSIYKENRDIGRTICAAITNHLGSAERTLNALYDDLTICDLFEGEKSDNIG